MSRLIEPPVPPEVAVFYDALSNRVRGKIVSLLSAAESMSTAELEKQLNIGRSYLIKQLDKLEEAGLVVNDTPREQRKGRVTQWRVNPARLEELLAALSAFLRGSDGA